MPRRYSTDLRERALLACEQDEGSFTALARRLRVGVSTLQLWRKQAREGQRPPRPLGRGPAPLDGDLLLLNALVAERHAATRAEYGALLAARTGEVQRTGALPGAEAARLGHRRTCARGAQAKTLRASEQGCLDVAAGRLAWRAEAVEVDPKRFVFLDG